jgi:transcriptional regulator with XRE-family HTH domain
MNDLRQIGQWVERERKARHWTKQQLAARAGVSENTVYLLETGANARVSTLSAVLGVFDAKIAISPS